MNSAKNPIEASDTLGASVLEVRGLSVAFPSRKGDVSAIEDVSFDLRLGQTTCFVGESGSGKSVTARAVMNIVEPAIIKQGAINLVDLKAGQKLELSGMDPDGIDIRAVRGARIAMIFQEPMSSLSPVHTIGDQIIEAILLHQAVDPAQAREIAIEALSAVQIKGPEIAVDKYPFEYSGGMRQRAMIAMALACQPDILIADEPTTALDVTTQAEILRLLRGLQDTRNMAIMFITHDMGVVAEIGDQVVVMLHGKVVESGDVDTVFHAPKHRYTKRLLDSALGLNRPPAENREASTAETLIETRDVCLGFPLSGRNKGAIKALDNVSLDLKRGEILGVVGESGSGGILSGANLRNRVAELLERVGLPSNMMERYPHAFSGGQRQRISIARAIALEPRVIIADEATSALDGSIRSQILDLLLGLRSELDLAILFIAHDIGVVRYFCDRVVVMHQGRVVETGTAIQICDNPQEPYTRQLISAVPIPDPRKRHLTTPT